MDSRKSDAGKAVPNVTCEGCGGSVPVINTFKIGDEKYKCAPCEFADQWGLDEEEDGKMRRTRKEWA